MIKKIISGGQTGADRAGLDWALKHGIEVGGWCPKGRRAEDGIIPSIYPLQELESVDYAQRTKKNVEAADGTVIFSLTTTMGRGSQLTWDNAKQLGIPVIHLWGEEVQVNGDKLREWVQENNIQTLNIAGSRASAEPGLGDFVGGFLGAAFL